MSSRSITCQTMFELFQIYRTNNFKRDQYPGKDVFKIIRFILFLQPCYSYQMQDKDVLPINKTRLISNSTI